MSNMIIPETTHKLIANERAHGNHMLRTTITKQLTLKTTAKPPKTTTEKFANPTFNKNSPDITHWGTRMVPHTRATSERWIRLHRQKTRSNLLSGIGVGADGNEIEKSVHKRNKTKRECAPEGHYGVSGEWFRANPMRKCPDGDDDGGPTRTEAAQTKVQPCFCILRFLCSNLMRGN